MTQDIEHLIYLLRTGNPRERKLLALQLAKTGKDEAVDELIRMIEGKRRHWLRHYTSEDQLVSVEALGETQHQDALDYLKHVYQEANHEIVEPNSAPQYNLYNFGETSRVHRFPNAPPKLVALLDYSESIGFPMCSRDAGDENPNTLYNYNLHIHESFKLAIKKLESNPKLKLRNKDISDKRNDDYAGRTGTGAGGWGGY